MSAAWDSAPALSPVPWGERSREAFNCVPADQQSAPLVNSFGVCEGGEPVHHRGDGSRGATNGCPPSRVESWSRELDRACESAGARSSSLLTLPRVSGALCLGPPARGRPAEALVTGEHQTQCCGDLSKHMVGQLAVRIGRPLRRRARDDRVEEQLRPGGSPWRQAFADPIHHRAAPLNVGFGRRRQACRSTKRAGESR